MVIRYEDGSNWTLQYNNPNYIQFNTTFTDGHEEGRLQWNMEDGTLEVEVPSLDLKIFEIVTEDEFLSFKEES